MLANVCMWVSLCVHSCLTKGGEDYLVSRFLHSKFCCSQLFPLLSSEVAFFCVLLDELASARTAIKICPSSCCVFAPQRTSSGYTVSLSADSVWVWGASEVLLLICSPLSQQQASASPRGSSGNPTPF